MAAETPGPQRLTGLDAAKALAIVGVVLIHSAPEGASAYERHVVNGLARLAVPCFLVVTGMLAGLKDSSRRRMRGYALKFLRLHLIYGAFYWIVSLVHHGLPHSFSWKYALLHFGEASYPGQYYFVILIQSTLLAWLLPQRLWRSAGAVVLWAGLAAGGVTSLTFSIGMPRPESPLALVGARVLTSANGLWLWFYFFALGATLGWRRRQGVGPGPRAGLAWVAAGLLVAGLDWPDWPDWGHPPLLPYLRLPVYAGATLVALGLPGLLALRLPEPLLRLGRESFTAFVLNPALLLLLSAAFGWPGSAPASWAYTAMVLVVAVALARPLRRHAPFAVA